MSGGGNETSDPPVPPASDRAERSDLPTSNDPFAEDRQSYLVTTGSLVY